MTCPAAHDAAGSNLMSSLADQLMAYFGDQDRESAVAELRQDIPAYPETARIFREGLARALGDESVDCVALVENAANFNVNGSEQQARTWLAELQVKLFPA
jgi:polyhydroxyalkanoate synthesis regulator protein